MIVMMKEVNPVMHQIEKWSFYISGVVCILVTLIIVTDVFLRFTFNQPLPATWEISELLMPFIIFLAFAYTLTMDAHIRVKIVTEKLPLKMQLWLQIFGNIVAMSICALVTYYSFKIFWESFVSKEEMYAAIKLPWWVGKAAMPFGMGMLMLRYLIQIGEVYKRYVNTFKNKHM